MNPSGQVAVIASDEPILSKALREIVLQRVSCVETTTDIDSIAEYGPGLVLVAHWLLSPNPRNGLGQVMSSGEAVIVFGAPPDPSSAHACLHAGARGYLSRHADDGEVLEAVDAVLVGGFHIARQLHRGVMARLVEGRRPSDLLLSPRERDVAGLLANGHTTIEIASALFMSPTTVKSHLEHIYTKLGVSRRAAAISRLAQLGVLQALMDAA